MKNKLALKGQKALEHYGVKGMQWGVRKKRSRSAESKEVSALRKKKAFELTDDELKKVNSRLNLEKQYKEVTSSTANKIAKKAVVGATVTVLTTAAAASMTSVGKAVINYGKKKAGGG